MRCCDCEFRYKCDESEKVLTAFLSCERRNKFLSEKSVDNLDEIKNVTIDFGVSFNRLKELAEADKEGRCLVLPCKVGELPDEDIAIPEIQILKKPAKCKVGYCQSNSTGYSYVLETKYHCPTCGVVVSEYTDFCPRCRQLLEWNKEEEE